jgi:hypothetical protein
MNEHTIASALDNILAYSWKSKCAMTTQPSDYILGYLFWRNENLCSKNLSCIKMLIADLLRKAPKVGELTCFVLPLVND